jgi:D-alanyl-D-alanine carboxypeptidase (penicillin-binding protein 5/6)
MFLEVNEAIAFGELVTGMATISANDACVAIAEHLSGSESRFVAEMNRKAEDLGLTATIFQNASGLPHPEQYSSALDMARLAHYYLQKFPEALALHSRPEYVFNDILQHNRNPLLGRFPGADGLKTGHTDEAGFCLIATAEQKGMRFIAVLLNGSSRATRLRDSEILLNYAFRNYTRHPVFTQGEAVTVINITGGVKQQLGLQTEEAVEVTIPFHRSKDLVIKPNYPPSFAAPISRHAPLGSVRVYLDDVPLAETALLAADSVEKASTLTLTWRSITDFLSGIWSHFTDWLGRFFI